MLVVALIPLVLAVQGQGTTFLDETLGDRSYILHLPSAYDETNDVVFPLVINLHGYTSYAEQIMDWSNMNLHADLNGYIAVYPRGESLGQLDLEGNPAHTERCEAKAAQNLTCVMDMTYWNDFSMSMSPGPDGPTCAFFDPLLAGWLMLFSSMADGPDCTAQNATRYCNLADCRTDDIGFIEDLIDELEANYNVDDTRVYATGFSAGAMMAQRLGCELPERFAAIAPIHGQPKKGFNCVPSEGSRLPILQIYGTEDATIPAHLADDGSRVVAWDGSLYTSVEEVMYEFGEYNGCDVSDTMSVKATSADGIRDWQCKGYDSCNFDVMACSWNATHSEYPKASYEPGDSFALDVMWEFFQKPECRKDRNGPPKGKRGGPGMNSRKKMRASDVVSGHQAADAIDDGNAYEIVVRLTTEQVVLGALVLLVLLCNIGCGIMYVSKNCKARGYGRVQNFDSDCEAQ